MKTKVFDQLDYKKKKYLKALFFLLLYLICAIGYTFFTFRSNIAQGADDLYFHAGRAVGLESILQSPINFKTYGAVGFPINIFYGWITIYPMYFLISVLGQVVIGYNVYFVLLTFTTFLICHFSFTKLINSSFAGCIFSLSYTFSAYRAMDVFSRAAVGESISLSLFPLVFCSFYLLLTKKNHPWKLLAISMSLLIYSHVLSSVLTTIYLFVLFIGFVIYKLFNKAEEKNNFNFFEIVVNLSKSVGMTLLLTCFFYFPMLEQFSFQSLTMPDVYSLDSTAVSFGTQLIEGALNNDLQARSIGVVLFIFLIILFLQIKRVDSLTKILLALSSFSLVLSTNLVPWSILQNTKLSIIQFPWRLNGFSTLFIAAAFSVFLSKCEFRHTEWIKKGFLVSFMGIFLCALNYASIINLRRDFAVLPFSEEVVVEHITPSTPPYYPPEYLPKNFHSKEKMVAERKIIFNENKIKNIRKAYAAEIQYDITAPKSGIVEVPIYKYKGYKILVDGQRVPVYDKASPIINFKVNSGPHHIVVGYEYTKLAKLSALVSAAGVLILIILGIYDLLKKYRLKSRNSV